ncbi:hypothetical protein IMCC14465_10440 [alpha proteobacterium IMCC14465]|uniref:Ribosome maturation factor RimM n=1 Tax=alpha proteobacterium IMCC14465 TaxID=1220535 RepID=J9DGK2_9PROT|nr:hypothetical protein IMCC14465_10440 [alpha proteobacterium IMCC14465]
MQSKGDTRRDKNRICVGAIAGAHGVKGDVRIKTFTEDPMDIAAYGVLSDEAGQTTFEILTTYPDKMGARVRFRNVTSRSHAETLKGTRLYIDRENLPDLEDEDFYHADLIGLVAVTDQGETLGEVKAVHNFGAEDLLDIDDQLIPFTKSNVPEIDFQSGTLTVIPPQDFDNFDDEASE